jgi:nitrogen-specific signal transduction histidine kinase/DNA-binding NarL/FixJ family response regulator
MNTLLVIAPDSTLSAAIRAALDPERYRVLEHNAVREDELRVIASTIDACIFDADLTTVEPIRAIERLRRVLPVCPIILYASESHWTWEEDAYLLGVSHILSKPVRGRLLYSLLERLLAGKSRALEVRPAQLPRPRPQEQRAAEAVPLPGRMLQMLRNSSSILCHSLSAEPLLREFLLLLREILGVNRAAIFLRQAPRTDAGGPVAEGSQRLSSACAIGLSASVLSHFALSLDEGIGGHIFRSGRLLRRESEEVEQDPLMQREFELLGVRVAIPILDRESLIGVAVFDERITGGQMGNEELALIFHLLEQLGLAIKNIWWHDQVSARHEMMFDILRNIKTGCIVVGREFNILHANEMAQSCFARAKRPSDAFDFNDLPQIIASKVFEVLKTGKSISDYKYQPLTVPSGPRPHYQVSIVPFRKDASESPSAALVVIDDCTAVDRIRQLEIETANLRLVQQMAERLAHEIGNAVVPISTHQQLLRDRIGDADFQQSLAAAMEEGVRRVSRLVEQMRFLAQDHVSNLESVPVKQLIEEAFREASAYHPSSPSVLLQYESTGEPLAVSCDRQGMQHAFAEVILNALQAGNSSSQVQVRTRLETDASGSRWARIEVQDSGKGFSAEAADKAPEPFFTTRKVGLGLGLSVTNKIIQTHFGKLEIPAPREGSPGLVRISLPLDPVAAAKSATN